MYVINNTAATATLWVKVSAGPTLNELPPPEGARIFPQFSDVLLVVTLNPTIFFIRHSLESSLLWTPLPNPFSCNPSFTPTYKAFHYQGCPFTP